MIPIRTTSTGNFLEIHELKSLSESQFQFFRNTTDSALRQKVYGDLLGFMRYCVDYADKVLKGATYGFDHVAPQLFVTRFSNDAQYKSYLRYALYAAKLYAEKLITAVKLDDIENCEELIMTIMADYEWLLAEYERCYYGNMVSCVCHGSRRSMNPLDLKFSAYQLMFSEQTSDLKHFDYRNTKPVVMFIVRQCLELLGKNIIGFEDIIDVAGNPIHQFTQISWAFLHDMEKQGKVLVKLPMKAVSVHALVSWTNSYVHNAYIYASYIQYYALEMLNDFSRPASAPVLVYDGRSRISTTFGQFEMPSFSAMKQEFTAYVQMIRPNLSFSVNWLSPANVGAYIKAI